MQIEIQKNKVEIGDDLFAKSKWWGYPDLLQTYDWPMTEDGSDLTFICQINCRDIKDCKMLPESGLLLFFADIEYYLGNDEWMSPGIGQWSQDSVKVIYIPEEKFSALKQFVVVDDDGEELGIQPYGLTFVTLEGEHLLGGDKLFGEPDLTSGEYRDDDICLLLQIDSEEDNEDAPLRFFDMGMLHIYIDRHDLAVCDFTKVKAELVSL